MKNKIFISSIVVCGIGLSSWVQAQEVVSSFTASVPEGKRIVRISQNYERVEWFS